MDLSDFAWENRMFFNYICKSIQEEATYVIRQKTGWQASKKTQNKPYIEDIINIKKYFNLIFIVKIYT